MKKYIITSCIIGIICGGGLTFAYNATIDSQSQQILDKIKQNSQSFTPAEALMYYKLEQKETERLIILLEEINKELKKVIISSNNEDSNSIEGINNNSNSIVGNNGNGNIDSHSDSRNNTHAILIVDGTPKIDFGVVNVGELPRGLGREFKSEKRTITLVNASHKHDLIADNISVIVEDSRAIELSNECNGMKLKHSESCSISVIFIPGRAEVESINTRLIITGNFQSLSVPYDKIFIDIIGSSTGFCSGEAYGGLEKPTGPVTCSSIQIQSGCYANEAFNMVKVNPICMQSYPTRSDIGTWISNSLPGDGIKTDNKTHICYIGRPGALYENQPRNQWKEQECRRRWSVPEFVRSEDTYPSPKKTPSILVSRKNTSEGQNMSWETTDTETLSINCVGPNGISKKYSDLPLNRSTYFTTWSDLYSDGYTSGFWSCLWSAKSHDGTVSTFSETFTLQ